MDKKYCKILTFLYDNIDSTIDISPVLLEMYPNVDRMNMEKVHSATTSINQLLTGMNGLIIVQDYTIGSGNQTNGFSWIDIIQIKASITQTGKTALDIEYAKVETSRLLESSITTNKSIIEANSALIRNLKFQVKSQILSIALGGLSVLFIAITAIQTHFDKTAQRVQEIQPIMQKQSYIIQQLDSSLREINSSIRQIKKNSK